MTSASEENIDIDQKPEENFPPASWSRLTNGDSSLFTKIFVNRHFDISLVYAVARRCAAGFPQVVVCRPVTGAGTPFPTLFWLTCPCLDKRCGELESLHKITELEEVMRSMPDEAKQWHADYAKMRLKLAGESASRRLSPSMLRSLENGGVGGIDWHEHPHAVKCLHLQTAAWLAWRHPASAWLTVNIGRADCDDMYCKKLVLGEIV